MFLETYLLAEGRVAPKPVPQVVADLRAARRLIESPENWTRIRAARTVTGIACDPTSQEAHSFCAYGAICRIHGNNFDMTRHDAMDDALSRADDSYVTLNDNGTHAQVLALFDEAIAMELAR